MRAAIKLKMEYVVHAHASTVGSCMHKMQSCTLKIIGKKIAIKNIS